LENNIIDILIGGICGGGLTTGAIALINLIKARKMLPKELKAADLDNREKELKIAEQMEGMATRAVEKAIGTQDRLDKLESNYDCLEKNYFDLKKEVEDQNIVIEKQGETIAEQGKIIAEQAEVIEELTCDLENNKLYNTMLIKQMEDARMVPIAIETIPLKIYNKKVRAKKKVDGV